MMRPSVLILAVVSLLTAAAGAAPAQAQDAADDDAPRVQVQATGQAPAELPNAREAAVEDALRRAVEAGMGVELVAETEARDSVLVRDAIFARTAGYVERYDVLEQNPDQDGLFTVRVQAVVTRGDINDDGWGFVSLLRRKQHPRLMVVGSADGDPFDRRLTAEVQSTLEQRGITVIDLDRLTAVQRRDAERAAQLEDDLERAALITDELGADYFVVVEVEGTHEQTETHGIELHRVDATGILRVIRVDTAQVLASQVVYETVRDRSQPAATRLATSRVTQAALERAIGRVAENWLSDVDQRGGQQIELVFDRIPFDRLADVIQRLREVDGVSDVIVGSTDARARSHLRVITNHSAPDLAAVLQRLDGQLRVASSTTYRVEFTLDNPARNSAIPLDDGAWIWAIGGGIGLLAVIVVLALLLRRPGSASA